MPFNYSAKKGDFPLTQDNAGSVLLLGSLNSFFESTKLRYPKASEFRYSYEMGPNETQWVLNKLATMPDYDTIIICVSCENHVKIAEALKNKGKRLVVFSIRSPVMVEKLEGADTILLGYSSECDYTLKAMAGLLNGEYTPVGVKPYN